MQIMTISQKFNDEMLFYGILSAGRMGPFTKRVCLATGRGRRS